MCSSDLVGRAALRLRAASRKTASPSIGLIGREHEPRGGGARASCPALLAALAQALGFVVGAPLNLGVSRVVQGDFVRRDVAAHVTGVGEVFAAASLAVAHVLSPGTQHEPLQIGE